MINVKYESEPEIIRLSKEMKQRYIRRRNKQITIFVTFLILSIISLGLSMLFMVKDTILGPILLCLFLFSAPSSLSSFFKIERQ